MISINDAEWFLLFMIVQRFMEHNDIKLIIRSHEGPDARYMVEDRRANIKEGFSLDHITPLGNLYTVFSAPDYPQHQVLTRRSAS